MSDGTGSLGVKEKSVFSGCAAILSITRWTSSRFLNPAWGGYPLRTSVAVCPGVSLLRRCRCPGCNTNLQDPGATGAVADWCRPGLWCTESRPPGFWPACEAASEAPWRQWQWGFYSDRSCWPGAACKIDDCWTDKEGEVVRGKVVRGEVAHHVVQSKCWPRTTTEAPSVQREGSRPAPRALLLRF